MLDPRGKKGFSSGKEDVAAVLPEALSNPELGEPNKNRNQVDGGPSTNNSIEKRQQHQFSAECTG